MSTMLKKDAAIINARLYPPEDQLIEGPSLPVFVAQFEIFSAISSGPVSWESSQEIPIGFDGLPFRIVSRPKPACLFVEGYLPSPDMLSEEMLQNLQDEGWYLIREAAVLGHYAFVWPAALTL